MQPSADKPAKGFTMIPNAVVDSKLLTADDKLVIMVLTRHAYGKKIDVWPSQVRIAGMGGISRKSVRTSLKHLTALGVAEEVEKDGRGQVTYRLHVERIAQVPGTDCPDKSADLGKMTHQAYSIVNTPKDAHPAATSIVHGSVEPSRSEGNEDCSAYTRPGQNDPGPQREQIGSGPPKFSKRQINELMLTPNLKLPDDEADALECNLDVELAFAGGDGFNFKVLEELVKLRGPTFCAFWTSWLLRKIAAEYAAGRPVINPAGLYTQAVREGWEVDPSWPEFDEHKHTWKAREVPFDALTCEVDTPDPDSIFDQVFGQPSKPQAVAEYITGIPF